MAVLLRREKAEVVRLAACQSTDATKSRRLLSLLYSESLVLPVRQSIQELLPG